MYFRQCWREARIGFVVALVLMVFLAMFSARVAARYAVWATHSASAGRVRLPWQLSWTWEVEWKSAAILFTSLGVYAGVVIGLGFGATGMGVHASRGLHEFLFTRPRRRRYFAWGSWLAGASQVLLPVILALLMQGLVLAFMTGHLLVSSTLIAALGVGLPSLVIFSLTHWLTALARNPGRGITYAAAVSVGYMVLSLFVEIRTHLPRLSALLTRSISYAWVGSGDGSQLTFIHLNPTPIVFQSLLVLVFALLTQLTVERMDA